MVAYNLWSLISVGRVGSSLIDIAEKQYYEITVWIKITSFLLPKTIFVLNSFFVFIYY